MLIKMLLTLVVIVVVFLLVVALQPSQFRVERSVTIAAPARMVFPQVDDLHRACVWSPWLKMDPNVKTAYDGPPAGVGASSTWAGNNQIGEGRQTIIESRANELVRIKLEFFKPMKGVSTAAFALKPDGNQTTVTWSIYGDKSFASKAFCLFISHEKMIGGPFEKGLANLKELVEREVSVQ